MAGRRGAVSLCAAGALVLAARVWWVVRRRRRRRGGWHRPLGVLHKSTFAVRDPAESVAFCVKYLHCTEIAVPDPGLVARGIRWARLPGGTRAAPASEFHFIPWDDDADTGLVGGVDLDGDGIVSGDEIVPITQKWMASLIDQADGDMKIWSVYANTHVGWAVADLTPIVLAFQADRVPFFGPTRRADGVYQLYVELPYLHYLEVDSLVYRAERTGRPARPWTEVASAAPAAKARPEWNGEWGPCSSTPTGEAGSS